MRVTVFADDLTGANETAACFVHDGISARVHLVLPGAIETASAPSGSTQRDVVVYDTETRNVRSDAVADRLRPFVRSERAGAPSAVYKKIDSTLRGPFAAEIGFLMNELKLETCLVAPAFPAQGRTTSQGYQLVHGKPVGETAVAQDKAFLVRDSHLPAHLEKALGKQILTIGSREVEDGPEALGQVLRRAFTRAEVLVVDAEREDHVETLAKALEWVSPLPLLVGAAGLAKHLGGQAASRGQPKKRAALVTAEVEAGVLVACGSRHPATVEQTASLQQTLDVSTFRLDPALVSSVGGGRGGDELSALAESIACALRQRDVLLLPPHAPVSGVASALGRVVAEVSRRIVPGGLVMTGGDTAFGVFEALGVRTIEIGGEVREGIPFGSLPNSILNGLPFVTKAGGFGAADALVQCVRHLRPSVGRTATASAGGQVGPASPASVGNPYKKGGCVS